MARKNKRKVNIGHLLILIIGFILVLALLIFLIKGLFSSSTKETSSTSASTSETTVSFMGVGDNLIHDTVYNDALQSDGTYDFTKMYSNFKEDAQNSDISFINQETVLGGEDLGLSGYPTFNSPSEIAKNLEDTGFNLVNLATNHCLDQSEQGIINELNTFKQTDIVTNGVYDSQEAYDTIPTFKKKGITFSFLAYTYGTNGIEAPNSYNVRYLNDTQIKTDVEKAKKLVMS